ncbi:MAG TPA: hypothetical protein VFD58_10200 [Blastocatellia bacterium]|nr:hypothetical protein [Blastocatellia bacterium]
MKKFTLTILLVAAAALSISAWAGQADTKAHNHAQATQRQEAVVMFPELVRLQGALLKGEYVVIHDDVKKANGEDCLYIYTSDKGRPGKLVTSFHCTQVERKKADKFRVLTVWTNMYMYEIREIQFAGETRAHQVPS